ncbi:hypothetical protein PCYB_042180 [Plasmodium cynomolgi strain B]|uniref:C2CD5 C-terminal domain-containing protein n=1 Tax=Plasmodium cynomolgi (strain B) TaxID=1120755 RepID=K6UCK6_PLACD|nr:hypothetical protein PCYB_042180 [Plasmodium cynomolgi strain B]GAB65016.1 hypothetical protein PCYB_042180 [Plasmodium cynomolgi strain B]
MAKSSEEKKFSQIFFPSSRAQLMRTCNRSFALDRSENSLPFDCEFRKGGTQNHPKYFFYMCTLDLLPSIRFETFYEQQDGRAEENKAAPTWVEANKTATTWAEANKTDGNPGKANQPTAPSERKREVLVGHSLPRGTTNNYIVDSITKCITSGERQSDSEGNQSSELREANLAGPLLHKERDDLFTDQCSDQCSDQGSKRPAERRVNLGANECRNLHGEVPTDQLVVPPGDNPPAERKTLTDEEERRKKKTKKKTEKKNKNKGKHTYLNNLSKSYLYLIKRINLFSENNEQVDVVYEKINKAFNDLYNVLIFYIFANKMYPCCIYSIKYHFAFISVDVLEIMLTGHLVKIKNNNSISLELKSMNRLMQENLLKHFFNYLENYYIEKWQLFLTALSCCLPRMETNQKFSSIIITPLNVLPNVIIKKYFGIISLHIVKENVNLKQFDVFYQSIISDILFIAKSHIKAIGANLICSFKITNLFMREERSHAYALISICGDVAKI